VASSSSSRRWLQVAVGVGLSAFFLYLAARGIEWRDVATQLAAADYRFVPPMVIVGIYVLYVRSQRWRLLLTLATQRELPMRPIFSANAIGFMANMVLPLRAGEIARPLLLAARGGIPVATVLATVVVERVLDLLVLVCFAMWVVSNPAVPPEVTQWSWRAGVIMIVLVGGLFTVHFQRARLLPLIDRIWALLPPKLGERVVRLEHHFLDALATIGNVRVLLQAVIWSFYVWFLIAFGFALGFLSVGIDIDFIGGGITVATIVALMVSAPSAPGFVGLFQAGCEVALSRINGVSKAAAFSYSIVVHATQFTTQVVLGLVYLAREGVTLGDIGRMRTEETASEAKDSRDARE
jgi:uncharacterized protein (TIRG00374 family)